MSEPDATQLIKGSGLVLWAPLGSTLPTLSGHGEFPVTWPMAWTKVGYTDAGIDFTYTPTIKGLTVDEEASPVDFVLETEKAVLSCGLAEPTMANLNLGISASTVTTDTPNGVVKLSAGSQALNFFMIGVEGPAGGTNKRRVMIFQKAIASAAVAMKIQRKDKVIIPVSFEAVKLSAQDLFDWYEFTATAS